jgi:LAO/AO transport system kinase
MDLVGDVLSGSRLALARLLTQIENESQAGLEALDKLFKHTGKAHLIGVTGAPGTGKSSLVNQLARHYRKDAPGQSPPRVAIVAVDPSSPFTGGAILGDRIRMRELSGDPGVFIRSMASRGALGGLAHTTAGVVQAFDAAGFDVIFIETVGAGQAEVDIARLAHTTLVVEAPGLGDDIQAIKAGILEIADILVINKADRPGVESTEQALKGMLQLAHPAPRIFHHHYQPMEINKPPVDKPEQEMWLPPIQRTVAVEGIGVSELIQAISNHQVYLDRTGEREHRDQIRLETELVHHLRSELMARWQTASAPGQYQQVLQQVVSRRISPHQAAETLLSGGEAA